MEKPDQETLGSNNALTADELEIKEGVRRGVQLCRAGHYEDGYRLLRSVTEESASTPHPGVFYSYLGYGVAAFEARYNDGLALCERAIEMEFYNTENHFNLARTYMLLGARKKTILAIRAGLRIDPEDRSLRALLRELGLRRKPPLPFLSRNNPINRWMGGVRHFLTAPGNKEDGP